MRWYQGLGCVLLAALVGAVGLAALKVGDRWHPPDEVTFWRVTGAVAGALAGLWGLAEASAEKEEEG